VVGFGAGRAVIDRDEMSFIFEYCWSPFRNPASAPLIDCDVVADPTQWGSAE
jgi:hypothetical protein